jgi:hypothetical protein
MALEDAIEMLAGSFVRHGQPFDIEVALWGLSYRFPAMTRDQIRRAVIEVLGARAKPSREPIKQQGQTVQVRKNGRKLDQRATMPISYLRTF